jgi:tol-pal system protein YbgF
MRKLRNPIGWMMLTVGLLLYGCASVKDVEILDKEADRLYAQSDVNRKDVESLKKEFSALREEIKRDLATLQKENQNLRADLSLRVDTLQSEVRMLTSGVEEYKDVAGKPSKELDRIREDVIYRTKILEEKSKSLEENNRIQEERAKTLDDRLKSLEAKIDQFFKQADSDKSDLAREKESSEAKTSSTGAASLYKDAYEAFQKGDLDGSRRKFEAFLKQYPNTELSDNAQFWIGETFYQKRDYEKAILEYEKVIVKYPEGEKVSSALYKQAIAFLELGDKTNARNLLKRVMERYPQSEQAEMAKKRLETIK